MRHGFSTTRRSTRRAHPPRRVAPAWLRWALYLLRLMTLACTLQLSGGSHVVVDVLYGASAQCIDVCASPCKDDPSDHGCPPGCPDCSCPHGRLPSLPLSLDLTLPDMLAWGVSEESTPYRSGVPPSPPPAALDRPPRS